ncbi:hypothetical protein MOQ_001920 [Trypanosoma cruzi marinkellei]|uniref:Uncharacterized protein n=1 Tax=Trypanosoma cruzi marinkellei TaxID=85056 RepID=K2NF28_TRYCR|nr:hypothetical protein MOQ_001920 [Trypanosoma cruzi marinkellei]
MHPFVLLSPPLPPLVNTSCLPLLFPFLYCRAFEMGPKRGLKKTEEKALAVEDPVVVGCARNLSKWTERVTAEGRKIQQVQHVLSVLSSEMEACNKELADVYDCANLLTALRIAEYRQKLNPVPPAQPAKKQRGKRDVSGKSASKLSPDENSTEALLAAMDEKKRQKVRSVLVNLFRRNNIDSPAPNSPTNTVQSLGAGAPTISAETAPRQEASMSICFPADAVSISTSPDQRRPRDVPLELWDEVSKLRVKRIDLERRSTMLMSGIDKQLARFDLLVQNHGIATYAAEDLERRLQELRAAKSAA